MKSEETVIILNEQVMNAHYNHEVSLECFRWCWGVTVILIVILIILIIILSGSVIQNVD